jgi:hypothetical protein
MGNKKNISFEGKILREQATSRGGGVEIALDDFGYEDQKMTAYQNYLGGGLLGAVKNDCTIREWKQDPELVKIAEALARYFHGLTNPDSEWESTSFEQNQNMPTSAY